MIKIEELIKTIDKVLSNTDDGIDYKDLESIRNTLKELNIERDIKRHEVISRGTIKHIEMIHGPNNQMFMKFLFEKSDIDSRGVTVTGCLNAIIPAWRLDDEFKDGETVLIRGNFSPYQVTKNGKRVDRVKIYCDSVEHI